MSGKAKKRRKDRNKAAVSNAQAKKYALQEACSAIDALGYRLGAILMLVLQDESEKLRGMVALDFNEFVGHLRGAAQTSANIKMFVNGVEAETPDWSMGAEAVKKWLIERDLRRSPWKRWLLRRGRKLLTWLDRPRLKWRAWRLKKQAQDRAEFFEWVREQRQAKAAALEGTPAESADSSEEVEEVEEAEEAE